MLKNMNAKPQQSNNSGQGNSKSARRRRAKKLQTGQNGAASMQLERSYGAQPVFTSGAVSQTLFTRKNRSNIGAGIQMGKMTDAGLKFLKSTFAAPDFAGQGTFDGIPDDKTYSVAPYRHILAADLFALLGIMNVPLGQKLVLVQLPTPGVAFWWAVVTTGVTPTTIFTPVAYDQFDSLFGQPAISGPAPPVDVNRNVNAFRMAGNSIELICTSNSTQWSGSIRALKGNCSLSTSSNLYSPDGSWANFETTTQIVGLENANSTGAASFIAPSNLGVFMTAVNKEVIFNSHEIPDSMGSLNGNNPYTFGVLSGIFTGFGDLETNFVILEGTSSPAYQTQFSVRCWQTVEYVPVNGTIIYNMSSISPRCDPVALELYRAVVADLPVAVTYFENDSFWKRLLSWTGKIGNALAGLPGPYGLIAGGVGGLASTVSNLVN